MSKLMLGKRLIITGFSLLALVWVLTLLSSQGARWGVFANESGGGIIDATSIFVVIGFALSHLIAICLVLAGLVQLCRYGINRLDKSAILLGSSGSIFVVGGAAYVYIFVFGSLL